MHVGIFVARCREIEDPGALAALASIGIEPAQLDELEALVATVKSSEPVAPDAAVPSSSPARDSERIAILRKIHAWVSHWSVMARAQLPRKEDLIHLGLARRKPRKARRVSPLAITTPAVERTTANAEPAPDSRAA